MCEIVGTSQIVAQRREIMNVNEKLCSFKEGGFACSQILAGSTRDGFRFDQSDVDLMYCYDDTRVVWDSFQFSNTTECKTLFDNSKSQPGYGLLQILGKQKAESSNLVITIKGKSYLSGSALKAYICSFSPLLWIHGPCASFDNGITNVDLAVCLKSDDWPPLASPFVARCNKKAWPNPDLIHDIIKSGCHVVPVGSKSENEDVEWRISFSVAERKLVHDMSHSQFLLYGLLKLFLDEVINNCCAKNQLLCSYHIKTAVFWTLQKNLPECCSNNILQYFGVCLQLLLEWVNEGNCPNFFIPENNMFKNKIYGPAQQKLSKKLQRLLKDGPLCVFKCQSIQEYLSSTHTNDRPILKTNTDKLLSELLDDLGNISIPSLYYGKLYNCLEPLETIKQLLNSNVSKIEALVLRRASINVLDNIAFILLSLISGEHESFCVVDKIACQALEVSAKFGDVSDILFGAMYYYRTSRFKEALYILDLANALLTQSCFMNSGIERSAERITGQSLIAVTGRKATSIITLYNKVVYIEELVKEQKQSLKYPWFSYELFIPSYVLLLMLEFLCQRCIDKNKAMVALAKLSNVVQCDDGMHITEDFEDISWQILGICQELSGNLRGALRAYKKSLACDQTLNRIRSASDERIQDVENLLQIS